jgi:hypothetical protein
MKRGHVSDARDFVRAEACGYPANTIAAKIGRDPLAVRAKCVVMGVVLKRFGKPKFGARIKIEDVVWNEAQ